MVQLHHNEYRAGRGHGTKTERGYDGCIAWSEKPQAEEYAWRRKFVEQTIHALCTPVQQPTVFDVEEAGLV